MDFDSIPDSTPAAVPQAADQAPQSQQAPPSFDQMPDQTQQSSQPMSFDHMPDESQSPEDKEQALQDQYGHGEQQIKAGLEGALRGVITAPGAAYLEKSLGVDPKDILNRQEANPWTAGLSEAAGFAGSSLIPVVGQAGLIGKVGNAAVHGAEIANVGNKLAQGAIRLGSEMAAMGTLDQAGRMILDPELTATNALKNIGLSTALGALTGGALKGTGMLTKAAAEKVDLPAGLKSFVERLKQRAGGVHDNDLLGHELMDTASKYGAMGDELTGPNGLKNEAIDKLMQDHSPEHMEKIDSQYQNIKSSLLDAIENNKENPDISGKLDRLQYVYDNLASVENQSPTNSDIFKAINSAKQQLDGYTKFGSNAEWSEFSKLTKDLGGQMRGALEDSDVWGKAADLQKDVNQAWAKVLPAVKDMKSKFFNKDGSFNPDKLQSYLNQNGRATTQTQRQQILGKYADAMDNFQNTVESVHQRIGIDNPHEPLSMNAIKESLQKTNPWAHAADAWYDKKLSKAAGQTLGASVGGTFGSTLPVPGAGWIGAIVGGRLGEHLLPSIIQPMLESPISAKAFAAAGSMAKSAIEGDKAMSNAASGIFGNAAKTIPSNFQIKDTDKLDKQLKQLQQNPKQALDSAVNQPNYLQKHQQSMNTTAMNAATWINNQRPVPTRATPLDTVIPPTKSQQATFQRILQLGVDPMSIMKDVKDGSIQAKDIASINAMYPKLVPQLAQKANEAMMDAINKGQTVPYNTRMGLSVLMGQALDSTMTPQSIQAAQPQPKPPPQQGPAKNSGKSMKALGKTAGSYRTSLQTAEKDRADRD